MNLNLSCPINKLGYGVAATNILSSLINNGVNVSLFPLNPYNMEADLKHHINIQKAINQANQFDKNAHSLRIYHQFSMAESIGKGKRVGLPFFELDRFNEIEKLHLSSLDTILSASKWAASIIKDQIGVESPVTPLGVDIDVFKPSPVPKLGNTIFLCAGKWEKRKHSTIFEAFNLAFRHDDKVRLWMFCDNPVKQDENQKWETLFKSSPLADKIMFINRKETHGEVYDIMRNAHFGLFPARGEGWNLEALEMLAIGRKIIATNYSAHTEFCTNENSILLDGDGLEPAYDGIWFHGQGNWLKLGPEFINKFSLSMRSLYEQHQKGEDIFNHEGVKTANQFTWNNTALKIIDVLKEV